MLNEIFQEDPLWNYEKMAQVATGMNIDYRQIYKWYWQKRKTHTHRINNRLRLKKSIFRLI